MFDQCQLVDMLVLIICRYMRFHDVSHKVRYVYIYLFTLKRLISVINILIDCTVLDIVN